MVQSFVSRRQSLDRWQSALKRATDKGVKIFQIESTGVYVATSGSRPITAYQTDGIRCECPAGVAGDPVCQHRAKFWQAMGMLELDGPQAVACASYDATGQVWLEGSWSADECWYCSGRGSRDVVLDRVGPVADNIVTFSVDRPRPAA